MFLKMFSVQHSPGRTCIVVFITAIFLLCCSSSDALLNQDKGIWEEYKTPHFVVYYDKAVPRQYVLQVGANCENYYKSIAGKLGFVRSDFWYGNDRAEVFVYATQSEYVEHARAAAWAGGHVFSKQKEIRTFQSDDAFFDNILPHELAHMIFREFVGYTTPVPLWFEEGFACLNEKTFIERYVLPGAEHVSNKGLFVPAEELSMLSPSRVDPPIAFYLEASVIMFYLAEGCGRGKLSKFCKALRDRVRFDDAFEKIYHISSLNELGVEVEGYFKKNKVTGSEEIYW
ncbi:MAG: hypothetical protein PHH49_05910 [Candidatus Omnitrophica bacterium]|nr:hypothetical protein [Candidatus Omnitrophota bacterium]MDD5488476.1 hypothetical protein [Candidatus Omnitrophota bacterium]